VIAIDFGWGTEYWAMFDGNEDFIDDRELIYANACHIEDAPRESKLAAACGQVGIPFVRQMIIVDYE